ncbi:MAG: hypothetical protein P4L82_20365 [Ancalomicrobiaceae bacterium]|nr:hypothetical protein [Ancalomicrobiaceae bacterium]
MNDVVPLYALSGRVLVLESLHAETCKDLNKVSAEIQELKARNRLLEIEHDRWKERAEIAEWYLRQDDVRAFIEDCFTPNR